MSRCSHKATTESAAHSCGYGDRGHLVCRRQASARPPRAGRVPAFLAGRVLPVSPGSRVGHLRCAGSVWRLCTGGTGGRAAASGRSGTSLRSCAGAVQQCSRAAGGLHAAAAAAAAAGGAILGLVQSQSSCTRLRSCADRGLWPAGRGGYEQQQQAQAWQAYIAWEKGNAQGLPAQHLAARVALAYECALTVLQHFPEVGSAGQDLPAGARSPCCGAFPGTGLQDRVCDCACGNSALRASRVSAPGLHGHAR